MADDRSARLLARLLAGAGVVHFLAPEAVRRDGARAAPRQRPRLDVRQRRRRTRRGRRDRRARTRRAGALAAAGLFAAVFPANVKMAYDWRHRPAPLKALAYGRLPGQVPLIAWALHTARTAETAPKPRP